jgi:hypothetical protein
MDSPDLEWLKNYLRRKKTVAELKTMSDELMAGGATDELLITSNSFEGGSFAGLPNLPKKNYVAAIEEILLEAGEVPQTGGRQLMTYPDFSRNRATY